MASEHANSGEESARAAKHATRLFAVRLWREELGGGSEYRGSARDVTTGAFRSFRDWSDLVAFMVARLEQEEVARGARAEGEGGT